MPPPDEPASLPPEHEHLPRLSDAAYRGRSVVHWIYTVRDRGKGWLTPAWHTAFRWIAVHACARHRMTIPAYCLMPDHLHLLVVGQSDDSDQRPFTRFVRRFTNDELRPLGMEWQKEPFDHVLRNEERDRFAFEELAGYIAHNPVRAKLTRRPEEWAYAGSIVPGYPTLHPSQPGFWQIYWRAALGLPYQDESTQE